MSIALERILVEVQPTSVAGEARATTSYMPYITTGHQIFNISSKLIDFPILEMKEHV
jgi:hypothetical protein